MVTCGSARVCVVETGGFRAEQQDVAGSVVDVGEGRIGVRGEREHPGGHHRAPRGVQVRVHGDRGQVVVVQARPAQLRLREVEAEGLHEVQFAPGPRDHPDRVAGVRRDPRRVEHDPEQRNRLPVPSTRRVRTTRSGTHVELADQ